MRRATAGLVVLVLVALGAGLGGGLILTTKASQVQTRLDPLAVANDNSLEDLTSAQSGLRGYVLTGRPELRQDYHAGVAAFARDSASQAQLAGFDPRLANLSARAHQAGLRWIDYTAGQAAGPAGPGASIPQSTEGTQLFAAYRAAYTAVGQAVAAEISRDVGQARLVEGLCLGGMTLASLIAVASGVIVFVRVDRSLTRPVDRIREVLARLARGDRSARAEVRGPTELRELASSVNTLADENERLNRATEERIRLRQLSLRLSRQVHRDLDPGAVMAEAVAGIGTGLEAQRVVIRLTTARSGWAGPRMAEWAETGLSELGATRVDELRIPDELFELIRRVAISQDQTAIPDVRDDATLQAPATQQYLAANSIASLLVQVVLVEGETLGALLIATARPRAWSHDEETLVASVADELGRALAHARLYAAQENLVSQLQELDKARNVFFSTVSHELRTPLTSVIGYLELLEDDGTESFTEQQREMLATIERNTERLRALIEDLLTLSRVEAGTFHSADVPVSLGDTAREVRVALLPVARNGQVDLVGEEAEEVWVRGDPEQLERVLLNLAGNAVKFTEPGGEVRVAARKENGEALLIVADTGIGIPVAEQATVFDQFSRGSNARQATIPGTGLGLSIVRAIVEHHQGSISLESEQGRGTTVTVRLPLLDASASQQAQPGRRR